jgi:MFS family permease
VFLRFVFSALLVGLIAHQGNVSLTGYMADQGHDEATYGLVVGWNGALIVLCQAGIGRRVGHLRPARVLAAGAALTGLGFSLHGVADAVPMHVLAVTVWTLGEMLQAPTCSTLVAALAPDDARGRYQGVFSLSWTLAAAIGPLWGPAVLARLGASELWGACLMLGLLGASVALRLEQPLVRRTASA